jgi:cell division protein ZapD
MRSFLRIEFLWQQLLYQKQNDNPFQWRSAIASLIEIMNFIERTELQDELIHEIDRHKENLLRLFDTPAIDRKALETVIQQLENYNKNIEKEGAKLTSLFKEHDFLNSLRQRHAIPGGTCAFDLPAYHYWLDVPHHPRQAEFQVWQNKLEIIQKPLFYILHLIRQSNAPTQEIATKGIFKKSPNIQSPCQIIQIAISDQYRIYPEMSGDKHRINIRFLLPDMTGKTPVQTEEDINFELTCCAI